ncbi:GLUTAREDOXIN DOMAIN-CONTAINING CYSTEINE-RICH PROTEIN CG12206-RELATED [Salix koriyanagi]|uniref:GLUTAREDOXIN DOMAIN-CONTAINING CYSTEINE-RICH PROTEIN CG12206-RELATED n=1 Tax=Salix koriyanagi TaxID=2511006 RepID=A0A9Q1A093_9ROSI|nr:GLUTAREDOXIN DOMAIN-CONTAINING CYSTEINE-RICH PROTEIN CG12206-RELATED [Salix koriyanagi]
MGCGSSKQKRCKHCRTPYSPLPRSYSMRVVHPPQQKGDSYHVVALTSTTLGTLALDSANQNQNGTIDVIVKGDDQWKNVGAVNGSKGLVKKSKELNSKEEFSLGLIEARTWSDMIQEKIPKVLPKTPIMTPPGEPETINTWELMAGLEDSMNPSCSSHRFRSFSFDISHDTSPIHDCHKIDLQQNGELSPYNYKPEWLQVAEEDATSKSLEFDPEVISTFRKSLEELSPTHPFYIKPNDSEKQPHFDSDDSSFLVNDATKVSYVAEHCKRSKDKLIVYFTSLRGVRKTYESCCYVRVILKSLGVRVDERDVSMHSGFKEELRELMKEEFSGGGLPRVFIGGKYVGGAEEIQRMHEEGKLEKMVEGCEMLDEDGGGGGGGGGACEACGDIRFVPCETCSGSCKIYYEADDEELEEIEESSESHEYGFQRCPDCNENGLIRCPSCCD